MSAHNPCRLLILVNNLLFLSNLRDNSKLSGIYIPAYYISIELNMVTL